MVLGCSRLPVESKPTISPFQSIDQEIPMSQMTRIISAGFLLSVLVSVSVGQNNLTAKANALQPQPANVDGSGSASDRARDGLLAPVRRVRTEVVKLLAAGGKTIEDSKHVLLETAEYDLKGVKTQNQYFPIEGATLTGREVYKYEFDSVGNWVKMTTSIAVVENAKISFEPSEVTYRTIFYYLDAAMVKMLQPTNSSAPPPANPPTVEANTQANSNMAANRAENDKKLAAALPSQTSFDKVKVSASVPSADLHSLSEESGKKVLVGD